MAREGENNEVKKEKFVRFISVGSRVQCYAVTNNGICTR
jgi:hypothetical protein